MAKTYKSFADLREALSGTVPNGAKEKLSAPVKDPIALEDHGQREMTLRRQKSAPRQTSSGPIRPRIPSRTPSVPFKIAFSNLSVVVSGVFAARGLNGAMSFADYSMHCLAKSVERRSGATSGTRMTALENIAREIAGRSGTRCKRLLAILAETPALSGDMMVRLPRRKGEPSIVQVERTKEASSVMEVSRTLAFAINETLLADLDTAKTTLRDSLRVEHLRHIRRTVPDFGSAIVTAAMFAGETPSLTSLSLPTIDWAIRSLKDLRDVLSEDDLSILKENLSTLIADGESLDTVQQRSLATVDAALEHLRCEFKNREFSGTGSSKRSPVVLAPRLPVAPKV